MTDGRDKKAKTAFNAKMRSVRDELGKFGSHAARGVIKLTPFGVQAISSACAFSMGLGVGQCVGYLLKVSCATPVLGSACGALSVGFASALAGQASRTTSRIFISGKLEMPDLREFKWSNVDVEEVLLDAVLGMCFYRAMAGPFSSVMPSNLAHPGAMAVASIPAKGDDYASTSVKRELYRMFKRDGCHHCGTRKGQVIGDHMPPNKVVWKDTPQPLLPPFLADNPLVAKVSSALNLGLDKPRILQRFYAQCTTCSQKQSAAMRNSKRVLVLHNLGFKGVRAAGMLVGMRHYNSNGNWPRAGRDGRRRVQVPFLNWSFDVASYAEHDNDTVRGDTTLPRLVDPSSSAWMANTAANSGIPDSPPQGPGVYLSIGNGPSKPRGMLIQTSDRPASANGLNWGAP